MTDKLKRIGIKDNRFLLVDVATLIKDKVLEKPLDGNHGEIHPKSNEFVPFGIPFVMASNIENGRIKYEKCNHISEKQAAGLRKGFAKEKDVILTHKATIGRTAVVGKTKFPFLMLTPQTTYYRVSDYERLNNKYLRCYFEGSLFQQTLKLWAGSGSTRAYIGITAQQKLPIILPPVDIQKKIAAVLSAYDDLIENNNRRIALLEIMAEKLYREWFVRMRFPEHEKTKFNKGIPEGWEPVPLASQAAMIMGQSPKSEFYNTKGEGLPFHQGVGSYGKRFPKTELYCSVKGRVASRGSILFSVRAPVGRINIADCEMIIGRGLAAINHTGGYNSYLLCMLKNYFSSEDIIGNGAIFNSVSRNELHKFPILLPTIDLIKKFEKIVGSIDSKIELHFSHIKNLTKSRDKLLSRLISGKLSVEGLDIRFPASMQDQAEASPLQEKRCA